eukprot:gene5367-5586_t
MAAQHDDAPSFLPHVTLIGGLNKTGQEVLETAEKLAGEIEKFDISLLNVSRGSIFFQCVYVLCAQSNDLMAAGALNIPQEKRDEVVQATTGRFFGEGSDYSTLLTETNFTVDALHVCYPAAARLGWCSPGRKARQIGTPAGDSGTTADIFAPSVIDKYHTEGTGMTSGMFSCCCLLGLLLLAMAPQVVHAQGDQLPLESLLCNPWRRDSNDDRMYQGTWLPISGPNNSKGEAVLRDFQWAVQCYDAVKIPYDLAREGVLGWAAYYDTYYTFVDLAIDPRGTEQCNPYDYSVFKGKVDLVKELQELADSWPVDEDVPVSQILFPVTAIFNRLEDTHVYYQGTSPHAYSGSGELFNGIFAGQTLTILSNDYWTDGSTGLSGFSVSNSPISIVGGAAGEKPTFFYTPNWESNNLNAKPHLIDTIGGMDPLEWLTELASTHSILHAGMKDLGNQFAAVLQKILGQINSLDLTMAGDKDPLLKSYEVKYVGGGYSTWTWAVSFPAAAGDANTTDLSEQASKPGALYSAMVTARAIMNGSTVDATEISKRRTLRERLATLAYGAEVQRTASAQGQSTHQGLHGLKLSHDRKLMQDSGLLNVWGSGAWGILDSITDKSKFAVWKLTDFSANLTTYGTTWLGFVKQAQEEGVTDLVIDLTANGGGNVALAYLAFGLLYPELLEPDNTEEWLNKYDARILYEAELLTNDTEWVEQRVAELKANPGELEAVIHQTVELFQATDIIVATPGFQCSTKEPGGSCTEAYKNLTQRMIHQYPELLEDPSILDVPMFNSLMADLWLGIQIFGYYVTEAKYVQSIDSAGTEQINTLTRLVNHTRGGKTAPYTTKFYLNTQDDYTSVLPLFQEAMTEMNMSGKYRNPFKKMLLLSSGLCGSSCDTFSRSAQMFSKAHPEKARTRFLTFGGTGEKKDLSGTGFPGGAENQNEINSAAWIYLGFMYTMFQWMGKEEFINGVNQVADLSPMNPAFNTGVAPQFTQYEVYQISMGEDALPQEFYNIPTDFYLKKWPDFAYTNTMGFDRARVYQDAKAQLKKMNS